MKIPSRWTVGQLLSVPNVLLRLLVEISHYEFAGIYSLNVIQIREVIMGSYYEMRNK